MDEDDSTLSSGWCSYGRPWWGRVGCVIFFIAFLLIFTSYVAPDWLQIDPQRAPRGTTFMKLGLWMSCYSNLHDPYYYDPYLTSGFEGCRWIYYPVVSTFTDLRDFLLPSFIIPVQISYTLCFITVLVLFFMILVYIARYKVNDEGIVPYLIVIGMMLHGAGLLGSVSVIVFGSLSSSRTWAHEWQFNDLSWAFAVAVIGVVLLHLAGVLFLIEAYCQYRRKLTVGRGRYSFTHQLGSSYEPPGGKPAKAWQVAAGQIPSEEAQQSKPLTSSEGFNPRAAMSKFSSRLKDRFNKKENGRVHFPAEDISNHFEDDEDIGSRYEREQDPSPPPRIDDRDITPPMEMVELPSPARYDTEDLSSTPPLPTFEPTTPPRKVTKDPIPTPRSPTQAEVTREALQNILQSVSPHRETPPPGQESPPDSGISMASPHRQMISSTMFDRFSAAGPSRPSKPPQPPPPKDKPKAKSQSDKEKPTFAKLFSQKAPSSEDELEAPPRVRRPSKGKEGQGQRQQQQQHYASSPIASQIQPLSIQTLQQQMFESPGVTTIAPSAPPLPPQTLLRPARPPPLPLTSIPPPPTTPPPTKTSSSGPVLTFIDLARSQGISTTSTFTTPTSVPIRTSPYAEIPRRLPISSTPIYSETRRDLLSTSAAPAYSEARGSPVGAATSAYDDDEAQRSSPKTPKASSPYGESSTGRPYEEFGLPPVEEAPGQPSNGRRPPSAAAAVAEILASRQPLSLRIHIQKHKTETSYKKSQVYGPGSGKSGQSNKNGNGFTESSI